jgi:4-carboxymuconolactone decarboxylase
MRIAALLLAAALTLLAQTPPPEIKLQGDRFAPLTWDTMTPEQRKMAESVLAGPRRDLGGPMNILLRSPEMGDLAQAFGASMRFLTSIPAKQRELAIILTARHWTAQFEWQAHARAAAQAGLDAALISDIAEGRRPAKLAPEEAVVYNFVTELLTTKQVSDPTFAAAKSQLGERGVVDVIGLMGWYQMVSMLLNVDRYPLPDGAPPPLKPLR